MDQYDEYDLLVEYRYYLIKDLGNQCEKIKKACLIKKVVGTNFPGVHSKHAANIIDLGMLY